MTSQLSDTIYKQMKKCKLHGFARVPNVFTTDEINRLRAEALISLRGNSNVEIRHNYPTLLFWPDNRYLQGLSKDSRLMEIVSAYYGHDDFELETQQYYFHLPGDPDEFAWHTDERFRPGVGNLYLQTAIVVDPWTEENSAVEFIKGSHLKPFENSPDLRTFVRNGLKGEKLKAQPGDVLTWSNTVVHGSERNKAMYPRAYYMNGFRGRNDAHC